MNFPQQFPQQFPPQFSQQFSQQFPINSTIPTSTPVIPVTTSTQKNSTIATETPVTPVIPEIEISFYQKNKTEIVISLCIVIFTNIFFIYHGFKMLNFHKKNGGDESYSSYGKGYIIRNIIFTIIIILILYNSYMTKPLINKETFVFIVIFIGLNSCYNIAIIPTHWGFILNVK
jgi:hypothetical protein